ncbi:hypothetical protein E2562_003162 [Oryza meyeriana var. granulata]|uniref:Uncharacterized protein n=1 Tax=Oryza meyeriana var. granulata TaxID=110450 RepID=A0A6G1EUL9_9ORYZ|nr:hypothetical protein E2562_003162 [Oryza meyeriana var. granulata]
MEGVAAGVPTVLVRGASLSLAEEAVARQWKEGVNDKGKGNLVGGSGGTTAAGRNHDLQRSDSWLLEWIQSSAMTSLSGSRRR